jgi:hypothetical protein
MDDYSQVVFRTPDRMKGRTVSGERKMTNHKSGIRMQPMTNAKKRAY